MAPAYSIHEATTPEEILECVPTIHALRPHVPPESIVPRVLTQQKDHDFHLLYLKEISADGTSVVASIVSYRIFTILFSGKTMYIDDVSTLPEFRGRGYAALLLQKAEEIALKENCTCVTLDSGVQRHPAHRVYIKQGYDIECHHFRKTLK